MAQNEVEVTVKGLPEVMARFKQATFDLQNKSARRAVGAAARNTARVAKRNAAALEHTRGYKHTDTLARSIIGHWSPKRSKEYLVHVGLVRAKSGKRFQKRKGGSQDGYYAGWVEFGHKVVPRVGSSYLAKLREMKARSSKRGRRKFTSGITLRRRYSTYKPVKAYPFMEPAWIATNIAALRIIEETLRRDLNKAGKK